MIVRGTRLSMSLAIATLALPSAFAGIDEDLAQAAKSPYAIERFVQTHVTFGWEPLWKALGVEDKAFAQPCGTLGGPRVDCSANLIAVSNPPQMIALLRPPVSPPVFLRFLGQGEPDETGSWRFGGYYKPRGKDPMPEHHILQFGTKPFLVVNRQDLVGSGVWVETEEWMDLTMPKFEPVLKLTTGARLTPLEYIENDAHASVVALETEPIEAIKVGYQVSLMHDGILLANRSDTATYTRRGTEFVFDVSRSTRPKAEIDALYDIDSAPPEDYLRYLLPEFKKIAAGPNGEMKNWLKRLLAASGDTPEKRAIQAVLAP